MLLFLFLCVFATRRTSPAEDVVRASVIVVMPNGQGAEGSGVKAIGLEDQYHMQLVDQMASADSIGSEGGGC